MFNLHVELHRKKGWKLNKISEGVWWFERLICQHFFISPKLLLLV